MNPKPEPLSAADEEFLRTYDGREQTQRLFATLDDARAERDALRKALNAVLDEPFDMYNTLNKGD